MRTKQHSSPSPYDQIPYVVFKQCPSLTTAIADLFSLCWKQGRVPSGWKYGAVWLIPKAAARDDPDTPSNFMPIALTLCVEKLFTTVLNHRWLSFMVSNGYLDTLVQKAFLPGEPSCLEQYTKLSAAISEAYKTIAPCPCAGWIWQMHMAVSTTVSSTMPLSTTMPLPVSAELSPTSTPTSRLPSPVPPGQPSPSLSGLVCTRATLCQSWCSTP